MTLTQKIKKTDLWKGFFVSYDFGSFLATGGWKSQKTEFRDSKKIGFLWKHDLEKGFRNKIFVKNNLADIKDTFTTQVGWIY